MAIALRMTLRTVCLAAIMTIGATGGVFAAETEEEESYYLSQMRDLASAKKGQPQTEAPVSNDELMAETDLEEMAKAAVEIDKVDEVNPSLNKPTLPALKPEL